MLTSICWPRRSAVFFENWAGGASPRAVHALRCSNAVGRRPGPEAPRFGCWVLSLDPRTLFHFHSGPTSFFRQRFVMAINAPAAGITTNAHLAARLPSAGLALSSLILCWIPLLRVSHIGVFECFPSLVCLRARHQKSINISIYVWWSVHFDWIFEFNLLCCVCLASSIQCR